MIALLRRTIALQSTALAFLALCLAASSAFAVRLDTGGPRRKTGPQILLRAVMANGSELSVRKTVEAIQEAGGTVVYKLARDGWYGVYYINAAAAGRGDLLLALFGNGACRLLEELPLEEVAESTHGARISIPQFPLNLYVGVDAGRAKPEDLRARLKGACLKHSRPEQGRYWMLVLDEWRLATALAALPGLRDVRLVEPVALPSDLAILGESVSGSTWAAEAREGFPPCPRPEGAPPVVLEALVPPSQKERPPTGEVTYYDPDAKAQTARPAYLGQVRVTFKDRLEPAEAAEIFLRHGGIILERPFAAATYFVQVPEGTEGAFIASVLREPKVAKAVPEILKGPR